MHDKAKCEVLVVAYENSATNRQFRGEVPTNLHFAREHIAFNFQVICEFHIVTGRFSISLSGVVHTANKEITRCACVKLSLPRSLKQWKVEPLAQKVVVVAVAWAWWSFSRGSNHQALNEEILAF